MENEYWEHFAATGTVEAYLTYQQHREQQMHLASKDRGEQSESDYSDGNGAISSSGW